MSTTKVKTYSVAPYYDDYDETKNYHRVLFRPGYAVQARELTQLQTALQAQIDRHGQYTFKDGSRVVNGKATLDVEYDFIKIESSFTHSTAGALNADNYLDEFVGTTITGSANTTNQVTAKVLAVIDAEGSDPNTLYIKYTSQGGANKDVAKFAAGEEFVSDGSPVRYGMVGGGSNIDGSNTASSITTPTGQGSAIHIEEGVYFISGCFVYVPAGTLTLDKYTNTPSYIVGLQVTESVVDSGTDTSLLDNAQGVPNTAAPGATRYKISTALIKESLDPANRVVNNYITLLKIKNGVVQVDSTDKLDDTELTQRLATRTFEESGNYAVRPFTLDVKEYLNDGTNNGYLTTSQIISEESTVSTTQQATDFGDARLAIGIEPSVAYVQGFRNEHLDTKYVSLVKPRGADATAFANTTTTQIKVGNYIKLSKTGLKGAPDLGNFTTISLRNSSNTEIGTARGRGLETYSDHVRLYLFDITMGSNSFSNVAKVYQAGTPQAFQGNLSVVGTRFDAGNNGLVFKLPYNAIKTLYSTNNQVDNIYKVRQVFTDTVASGTFSISIGSGQGTFTDVSDIIISAGTADVITDSSTIASALTGGNGSTSLSFNASTLGISDGTAVKIIASVQKNLQHKTKTRNNNQTTTINVTNGNATSYDLDRSDIIRIVSIVDVDGVNITDRFTLDNGQRDNFYDEGKILKVSGTAPVALGNMVITFDYYSHGSGDYFSVDSYPTADYDSIQGFSSNQGFVQLRDCIDFRPTKAAYGSITTGSEFSSGSGASLTAAPKPGHALLSDITYYLPRVDKLYITREGNFKIVTGTPSDSPKAPEDIDDAMTLYKLQISPYVFSPSDVKPVMIDNKRYTMRDIGAIDKRVKNLEYYTSLSLLEQSAADVQLFDGSNFSRFKNGFIVDGFRGHNVGNPSDSDYQCSIDKSAGALRPKFDERNINLIRKSGDTGTAEKYSSIVVMDRNSDVVHIEQPYASAIINVNPYDVFFWGGTINLSPESDEWKDVDVRPDVIIDDNSMYDQLVAQAEEDGILGTVWNEWETNWTGVDVDVQTTREREDFWWTDSQWDFTGRPGGGRQQVTTTTTTTTTTNQSRSGIRTDVVPDTVTKDLGSKVVEVNFVPFMRSRRVYFKAELMKPDSKVYAFFNGKDITAYCNQETYQEFSDQSNVKTFEGETQWVDDSFATSSNSGSLTVDSTGKVEGSFIIPRNASMKFRTGTREFRLTDSTTNSKTDESTFAEAQFHAQGLLDVYQRTIISTKVPKFVQTEVSDNRVLTESSTQTTTTWIDPLAETILIDEPGGIFVSSVDLFFRQKDPNIPVRVSIRACENGTPTQRIVPGADKVVYPSSVNVSTDASASTTVTFDHPVYLEQDQEYAIVIIAQTNNYLVWIAEMGGYDVTNANYRITKQPYNGVFFTSQNASTWTPEQSKDLKFTLNRASFNTSSSSEITLTNDVVPAKKLTANALLTTNGSATIRVSHKNHGMHAANSTVTISGSAAVNNIPASEINATHTIGNIEHDSYTITVTTNANATGSGGGSAIRATENRHMDVMKAIISNIQVPGTDIRFYATTRSQQSVDGNEAAYQSQNEFEVLPNRNVFFSSPKVIASGPNETSQMSGAKSFELRCVMTSEKDTLSPVIDLNRCSVVTVQNRISDAESNQSSYTAGAGYVAETSATGGSELARYITKRVDLAEEAEVIKVYLNGNRPAGSSIDLYYKVLGAGSDEDISTIDWVSASPNEDIAFNDSPAIYEEAEYDISPSEPFGSMVFKIVLRSSNSSGVPTVKDFRAIAAT